MAPKRKRLSLRQKIVILNSLKSREKPANIAKRHKINESSVRTIKRKENAIRKTFTECGSSSLTYSFNTGDVVKVKVERALVWWIEDLVHRRIPVDTRCIKEKATVFYEKFKCEKPSSSNMQNMKQFCASNGWLRCFLKRNSLHNVKITGESASADEEAAKIFPKTFSDTIKAHGYVADQIFNADGLYWKKMPSRTYVLS
ncbi:tigger transposable element-derived protein 1-like [Bactrocera dorsalis]|uniref:Tigger transposable element-derived protein 1-like n=1 Tax=Bactrocera dorsalis TaxID=27457 RepID=A0ABM3IZ28_BACDO|nr:tigger transposable element-derived protein 1-like [Bactrocera dorsalis]